MWLYYWLAAQGINPLKDVKTITVPPPQMVANMRVGNMDGFCVGEPWNNRAIMDSIGFTAVTARTSGPTIRKGARHHRQWVQKEPEHRARRGRRHPRCRQVDRRLAGQQAEDGRDHRPEVLRQYRYRGHRRPHARPLPERPGQSWDDKNHMKFFNDGAVNFPTSRRHVVHDPAQALGLLKTTRTTGRCQTGSTIDIYKQGAAAAGVALPKATCGPAS